MRYIKFIVFFVAITLSGFVYGEEPKLIQSCNLSNGHTAQLLEKKHGIDGIEPYLNVDGKADIAFQDMPNTSFIGEITFKKCTDNILIFAMAWGPPYQKGVAIRYNKDTKKIEKIFFSEKALPKYIYVKPKEWLLVVPNAGYEIPQKNIVYRFASESGQDKKVGGSDELPDKNGYVVTKLYSGKAKIF